MAGGKIILAHCSKTGKKFCLEVRERAGQDQVVNFLDLTEADYGRLHSEGTYRTLNSADTLLPCRYCGSQRVAGCACNRRRKRCSGADPYDFQCLYCDRLVLDRPKAPGGRIYVTGKKYDDIGEVLRSLRLPFQRFMGKYDCDLFFLNCGTEDPLSAQDLRAFVERGGCLYASDLASRWVREAFPGKMVTHNDGVKCRLMAEVEDPELLQITGPRLEIEFDLTCWSVVESTQGKVLLRAAQGGPFAGAPIMISFPYGRGMVFYTSFHNHAQASEKEKMLLQLLLVKQMGTVSHQSLAQMGELMGLNIASMRERFRR